MEGGAVKTVAPHATREPCSDSSADTKVQWQGRFFVGAGDVAALDAYVQRFPSSLVNFHCPAEFIHRPILHYLAMFYSRFHRDSVSDYSYQDLMDFENTLNTLQALGADVSQILPRVHSANQIRPRVEILTVYRGYLADLEEMHSDRTHLLTRVVDARFHLEGLEHELGSLDSRIQDVEHKKTELAADVTYMVPDAVCIDPLLPLGHDI